MARLTRTNSMFLYGKNSVAERIKTNPHSIKQVFIQDDMDNPYLMGLIERHKLPLKRVGENELMRIKRADRLQGIVAEVEKFKYTELDTLISTGAKKNTTLVLLDGINDPHNLGSMLRILACFGGAGVILPEHNSCEVNDTVMHVSQGGENYVPVSMVNNLIGALLAAKDKGYTIYGTDVSEGADLNAVRFNFPAAIIFGSEGKGIRHGVKKHIDVNITLHMAAPLSLNVSMASAVFCHEILKQKQEILKR